MCDSVSVSNGEKYLDDEGTVHIRAGGVADTSTLCGFASYADVKETSKRVTCGCCISIAKHVFEHVTIKSDGVCDG